MLRILLYGVSLVMVGQSSDIGALKGMLSLHRIPGFEEPVQSK